MQYGDDESMVLFDDLNYVEADVRGHILSVKNPKSGMITVDSVGGIIHENPVMECTGEVKVRTGKERIAG